MVLSGSSITACKKAVNEILIVFLNIQKIISLYFIFSEEAAVIGSALISLGFASNPEHEYPFHTSVVVAVEF